AGRGEKADGNRFSSFRLDSVDRVGLDEIMREGEEGFEPPLVLLAGFTPGAFVPTTTVLIDKLLTTVIQLKASDLHITVGQPPVIRHHGRMKRLDTKTLVQDDTTALMKSITPDRCQQELQEKGGADFAIEFTDGVRFRVAIFKQRGNIGMVLRRIPNKFLTFEEIGMPTAIPRLITRPRGLLLVTGPTGSGKTT